MITLEEIKGQDAIQIISLILGSNTVCCLPQCVFTCSQKLSNALVEMFSWREMWLLRRRNESQHFHTPQTI